MSTSLFYGTWCWLGGELVRIIDANGGAVTVRKQTFTGKGRFLHNIDFKALEKLTIGDRCKVTGLDAWLDVFRVGAEVVVVRIDHKCAQLPVRVRGVSVRGQPTSRWCRPIGVRKQKTAYSRQNTEYSRQVQETGGGRKQ